MITLSPRLKMVSDLVDVDAKVVDIGTDHAFLPAYLLINNIAIKALACELHKGPFCNAQKTVEKLNLDDRLELRLSDGLKDVSSDEADTIIICGMGGNLITKIISDVSWLKEERITLILQPQSHQEDVRKFLVLNGFHIIKESACEDSGKSYSAIKAKFVGEADIKPEWYYYFGELIYNEDEPSKNCVQKKLNRLKKISRAQKDHGSNEVQKKLESIISEVEAIINENG